MTKEKRVDESWKESAAKEKEQLDQLNQGQQSTENKIEGVADSVSPSLQETETGSSQDESQASEVPANDPRSPQSAESPESKQTIEVNFLNYLTSLGFQAMIFLGQIPNPVTNQEDKNLEQAKFLIDTLTMLKEKTQGNLTEQESELLKNTVYELHLRYVEILQKDSENG